MPIHVSESLPIELFQSDKISVSYIWAENSRDQLRLTRKMLCRIFSAYQIMPAYLDFMFVFGAQSDARDLRFSGFRESVELTGSNMHPTMLGGSGRRFQLCYNLKGVSLHKNNDENIQLSAWTIRQAAIYHQFDVVDGNAMWIVTKGRLDLQNRFKSLTGSDARSEDSSYDNATQCFASSLAAHLMYCQWSTEDWREYLRWLEDVVDREVRPPIKAWTTLLICNRARWLYMESKASGPLTQDTSHAISKALNTGRIRQARQQ